MYAQWSCVGRFYTTYVFFFFFFCNIWLRTVVSVIYSLFVCWASQQLLPIYELLCFCRCEWQLVKTTCHKGFSKVLQAALESFLRDSIKSHHFLFSFLHTGMSAASLLRLSGVQLFLPLNELENIWRPSRICLRSWFFCLFSWSPSAAFPIWVQNSKRRQRSWYQ